MYLDRGSLAVNNPSRVPKKANPRTASQHCWRHVVKGSMGCEIPSISCDSCLSLLPNP